MGIRRLRPANYGAIVDDGVIFDRGGLVSGSTGVLLVFGDDRRGLKYPFPSCYYKWNQSQP